jgi:hypothetical protein
MSVRFAFACLAFGQTATHQFAGTAALYTYFGSTVVLRLDRRDSHPGEPHAAESLGPLASAESTARARVRPLPAQAAQVPCADARS